MCERAVLREAGRQGLVNTVIHWSPHTKSRSWQDEQGAAESWLQAVHSFHGFLLMSDMSQLAMHRVNSMWLHCGSVVFDVERRSCCCSSSMDIEQSATLPPSLNVIRVLTALSVWGSPASCLTAIFSQNCSQCVGTLIIQKIILSFNEIQQFMCRDMNENFKDRQKSPERNTSHSEII